jgi:hypothetical protein
VNTLLVTAGLLLIGVCPAAAQMVPGPQGSAGGIFGGHRAVDPNRTSQRLSLNVDLSGGYDSNQEGPSAADAAVHELYAGTAQTGLRYWRGKMNRFFEASARGRMNYESRTEEQLIGGEAIVQASSSLGRRLQLSGGGMATYDPMALTTQFGPAIGESQGEFPLAHHPPQGVVQQQWLSTSGYLNLQGRWSVRQTTTVEYRASRREPIDTAGLQTQAQQASVLHSWNFRPSAALQASYRFDNNRQATQVVIMPPLQTSTADAGLSITRRYSPIRSLRVDMAAGAALAERRASTEAGAVDYLLPIGNALIQFNLNGVWSLMVEGTRDISVLEGITPEPFETTAALLQLEARVSSRLTINVSGTHSRGKGLETSAGAFETAGALAQLQYGFAQCCGLFSSYSFYNHHLRDLRTVPVGFPERYNRHVVRIGLTWWLPLYGSF